MRVRVKPGGKMPLSRRFRAASRQLSATILRMAAWTSLRLVCCCVYKKVAQSLAFLKIFSYLCAN